MYSENKTYNKERTLMKQLIHRKSFFVTALLVAIVMLTGCGSSSSDKSTGATEPEVETPTPGPVQTGDISLFPNTGLLASAESLLANEIKKTSTNKRIIVDTRSAAAYEAGHIPGAINLEWKAFAVWDGSATDGTLLPVAQLAGALGAAGITQNAGIVFYDDTTASWGSAGRFFWMLEYLGNTHVQVLNGGWDKWVADKLPTETAVHQLTAVQFIPQVDTAVSVDKAYIAARLGATDFVLVDTRTDEEFCGWQLYKEARGGHIPGAVHLPYEGYYYQDNSILSYADLKALFDAHGISADKELVGYCTAGVRSGFLYFLGRLMGVSRVANYDGSAWDWAAAPAATYPMEKMKKYSEMVYPAWVKALIDYHAPGSSSSPPPQYGYDRNHRYLIFETQWGSFEDMSKGWADDSYLKGHIPGAFHSNSDTYENGYPRWFLLPESELKAAVGSMGITADTTVVVYSNSPIFAARLWWILKYAGVQDVRFLNGGFAAWEAAGYPTETTVNEPSAMTFNGSLRTEMIASTAHVEDVHNNGNTIMADVRTYPEYTGDVSGYGYVVQKGRIPGAVYAFNADTPDLDYLDADGSLKNFADVRRMWEGIGIASLDSETFKKDVIFYCGSGYRSSLSFLYAYLMGYQNIRNYSDGWEGWGTHYIEDPSYTADPDLPGSTDGWIQNPSGRPVANGVHPEWDAQGYSHMDRAVNANWVHEVLFKNDNFDRPFVIAEVSWGPAGSYYNNGHIPGAIHVNTDEIEYDCFNPRNEWPVDAGEPACWDRSTTEAEDAAKGLGPNDALPRNWWNIYPDEYLLPAIAYMGIDKDTTVVVYGKSASAAARLIWTLIYAGVSDVRYLEGGYSAWTAAGFEGSTQAAERTPVADFGSATALHPEYKVDIPFVREVVNGNIGNALMVDIRTEEEYLGASAPYSYIPTDGRIPGAVWGKAGTGTSGMQDYVNPDGSLKPPSEIEAFWTSQGITADKHLNFYCGTAWRSSVAWFFAYIMGYPEISNFDSSWFEWSMGEGSAYSGADPVLNPIYDETPDLP
jgi:3-mercaptopyruvate sulfurtransferase SseA